jgi:hypothetical protein
MGTACEIAIHPLPFQMRSIADADVSGDGAAMYGAGESIPARSHMTLDIHLHTLGPDIHNSVRTAVAQMRHALEIPRRNR